MNDVLEIVSRLEQAGGILSLNGDQIEYAIPKGNREAQALLDKLRKQRDRVTELLLQREAKAWPSQSLDIERRFGQPHAKLFPFIGRKVRTPNGAGVLIQVFADRVTVLLDSELGKCAAFAPGEVEPVSWRP